MRLLRGLYGTEFRPEGDLFGLHCGQMHSGSKRMIKNAGWYNRNGEKLGFGDLSDSDFQRIAAELGPDELFIILGEQESFWDFVEEVGMTASLSDTRPTIGSPGVDYVSKHARYVIAPNQLYRVLPFSVPGATEVWHGMDFKILTPASTKRLIKKIRREHPTPYQQLA